jgi:hypothetical protein
MSLHESEERLAQAYLVYLDALQEEIGHPTEADWEVADHAIEELGLAR